MTRDVPLSEIVDNPFQPRTAFDKDAIRSLADEIKAEGFWNDNLQGRRNAHGQIGLVYGHRRLRALRLLKTPSLKIEILDLSDAQMALRALEENLQREGLSDLEKADAIRAAVEIAKAELRAQKKPESRAAMEVAQRLGISHSWVLELCKISCAMAQENRASIDAGYLTAKTAKKAQDWGGDKYVATLAGQGKASREKGPKAGKVAKPTPATVDAMKRAVAAAPEAVRETLKEEIVSGKLQTPKEAEARGRRLASTRAKREKPEPPDLRAVIVGWTRELHEWNQRLQEVVPYMNYVDEVP